jgi:hypothetical protein
MQGEVDLGPAAARICQMLADSAQLAFSQGPSPEGPILARGDVFEHWPVHDDCTVIGDGDPRAGHGMQGTAPLLQGIPGGVEPPAGGLADL